MVRTHNIGHLRDVRRLVVAMSRARLGLYVFARVNLFKNCFELTPAFNLLCSRPVDGLYLCPNEVHPTSRQANVKAPNPLVVHDMPKMCKFVYDFYAQKVAALTEISRPAKSIPTLEDAKVGEVKSEHKPSQHPGKFEKNQLIICQNDLSDNCTFELLGDDRDSDDEMEGKTSKPKVFNEIVNEVDA